MQQTMAGWLHCNFIQTLLGHQPKNSILLRRIYNMNSSNFGLLNSAQIALVPKKPSNSIALVITYVRFRIFSPLLQWNIAACYADSWGFIVGNRRTSWNFHTMIQGGYAVSERKRLPSREMLQCAKSIRTLMFCESVSNIVIRSIPSPQPPVGGKPYSRAVQNASSSAIASSSPDCRFWGEGFTGWQTDFQSMQQM